MWRETIEKNLDLRLNVDYQTINSSWKSQLMDTMLYPQYIGPDIDKYIQYMKANKLKIIGDYYVEPSTMYSVNTQYIRCWVKFRIESPIAKQACLYQGNRENVSVKTNTWYEGFFDISITSNNGGNIMKDFKVMYDDICGYESIKSSTTQK